MMSRRTTLKTLAVAMMSPVIQLRESIPAEKLLLPFCGDWDHRYHISEPFSHGSLTYATDSRAMVRCELANRLEIGEVRLPPVESTWVKFWQPVGPWKPLSEVSIRPVPVDGFAAACPECGERRVSLGDTYPDLADEAEAERVYRLGFDVDDNSIRDASCGTCHGLEYRGPTVASVLGVPHSAFLMKRITALPNAKVCRSGFDGRAILFAADGYEGISLGLLR